MSRERASKVGEQQGLHVRAEIVVKGDHFIASETSSPFPTRMAFA